jgi:hypothetical protein
VLQHSALRITALVLCCSSRLQLVPCSCVWVAAHHVLYTGLCVVSCGALPWEEDSVQRACCCTPAVPLLPHSVHCSEYARLISAGNARLPVCFGLLLLAIQKLICVKSSDV